MGRLASAIERMAAGVIIRRVATSLVISAAGIASIETSEGTKNVVYSDVVGISTVCTGHVTKERVGTYVAPDVCSTLLREDTGAASRGVQRAVRVPISQSQFDSLVSLAFNVGTSAVEHSTLVRKLNAGDCHGAAEQFLVWDMAGGRHIASLRARRVREMIPFEKDCP